MGRYVNQKCGSCEKSLTGGFVRDYRGIGRPYVVCRRCGAVNDNSARMTEWSLKSQPSKVFFVLGYLFSILFYFGVGSGVIGAILASKDMIRTAAGFFVFVGCSVAFGLLYFLFRLRSMIEASDARMSDDDYAAKVQRWR
jgi:hypothetical protein